MAGLPACPGCRRRLAAPRSLRRCAGTPVQPHSPGHDPPRTRRDPGCQRAIAAAERTMVQRGRAETSSTTPYRPRRAGSRQRANARFPAGVLRRGATWLDRRRRRCRRGDRRRCRRGDDRRARAVDSYPDRLMSIGEQHTGRPYLEHRASARAETEPDAQASVKGPRHIGLRPRKAFGSDCVLLRRASRHLGSRRPGCCLGDRQVSRAREAALSFTLLKRACSSGPLGRSRVVHSSRRREPTPRLAVLPRT